MDYEIYLGHLHHYIPQRCPEQADQMLSQRRKRNAVLLPTRFLFLGLLQVILKMLRVDSHSRPKHERTRKPVEIRMTSIQGNPKATPCGHWTRILATCLISSLFDLEI